MSLDHQQRIWERSKPNQWVFPKIGIPQNGWFIIIMENPIKMDWFGGTTIFGNTQFEKGQSQTNSPTPSPTKTPTPSTPDPPRPNPLPSFRSLRSWIEQRLLGHLAGKIALPVGHPLKMAVSTKMAVFRNEFSSIFHFEGVLYLFFCVIFYLFI